MARRIRKSTLAASTAPKAIIAPKATMEALAGTSKTWIASGSTATGTWCCTGVTTLF